jgi:hypothetical protein
MSGNADDRPAFIKKLIQPLSTCKPVSLNDLLDRHAVNLHAFKKHIAEMMVELSGNGTDLFGGLFRKGIPQVHIYHGSPVSGHMIYEEEDSIGNSVDHAEWHDLKYKNSTAKDEINEILHKAKIKGKMIKFAKTKFIISNADHTPS